MSPVLHRPVYALHVELLDIEPPIWRRVEVPAGFTLAQLHEVMQLAMGWEDRHMHLFEIGGTRYGLGYNEYDEDEQADADVLLGDLGLTAGDRFSYKYDLGDDWVHIVAVERIRRDVPEDDAPRLIGGGRACPPEDCGGVHGYDQLLEALADVEHEDHYVLTAWLGGPWDPEDFDGARHDRQLRRWAQELRAPGREDAGRGRSGRSGKGGRGAARSGDSRGAAGSGDSRGAARSGRGKRRSAAAGDTGDRTPLHMTRAGEVLRLMDPLRRSVPWLPDSVVDLTATLIQHFCLAEPDEFLAVRKLELWLAAGVHAAFMLHPYWLLHPLKPLTLQELAEICGVSVASISKRSRQLRDGVRVQWGPPGSRS